MNELDYSCFMIDSGSGQWKAGFAGEDEPRTSIPALAGRPKHQLIQPSMVYYSELRYVGEEALERRGLLDLQHPVQRGVVTNWDDIQKLVGRIFYNSHRACPEEHPTLFTEPPFNPKSQREKMTEVMIEKHDMPGIFFANAAVLASQRDSLVLDIGEGVCQVVPVRDGEAIVHAVQRMDLAGIDLTNYLQNLLNKRGLSFVTSAEHDIVREIKEKVSYVAVDFDRETEVAASAPESVNSSYELPDGHDITVGSERFRAAEPLFQPKLIESDHQGVHELVYSSIMMCDADIRPLLFGNVILAGGSTMICGFPERLKKELSALAPPGIKVNVIAPPKREYSAWVGGSKLASSIPFQDNWIPRQEYLEHGASLIHKKCQLF
ncbi:actin, non-muscle 6.2-like [Diadema antillarum]|uniref:actin, non-muscle 6.2-like n=1 Tax=Diadema antillarum TaxID=105358 RepID=UPI003A85E1A5